MNLCVFADGSAIDEFGIFYYATGAVQGRRPGADPSLPAGRQAARDVRAEAPMTMFFPSLAGYRPDWLRSDLIAGLTVWAVLVPEALAYATIAGVSPVVGLYAAPGRAAAVRRVRQLEAPRHRADGRDRGPVGGRRRRPRAPAVPTRSWR